jgi:hypothetical protein
VEKYGTARQATDDNIIWRMRFACWVTARDTHSEYVIHIAFPWQQWLRERVSVLRYTYIAYLVSLRTYAKFQVSVFFTEYLPCACVKCCVFTISNIGIYS